MSNYFASNLLSLRKQKGLTQLEAATALGLSRSTYANYESGFTEPDFNKLIEIANFLGNDLTEMLTTQIENAHLKKEKSKKIIDKNAHLNASANAHLSDKNEESTPLQAADSGVELTKVVTMPRVIVVDNTGEENAVFVPVKARAGYLSGYGDTEFLGKLPTYKIIGARNRTYRIWEVDGNSMFPTLHDKDTVDAYWVRLSEIRDDRIHVIVTKNDGILIKRVLNRFTEGVLVCKSDNNDKGEYPPIILPIHDVLEVWYVEKATTHNLAKPGEIYKRITDLEGMVAILAHNAGLLNAPKNQP